MTRPFAMGVANEARTVMAAGDLGSEALWRFGILQVLDDYESVRRQRGAQSASVLFDEEPPLTGHSGLDAAYAALACWVSARDGWSAPDWARNSRRVARPWWFVSESAYGRAWALVQSPGEFRIRGVFITDTALVRV